MTKKILIISTSRADYSLLKIVADRLGNDCEFIQKEHPMSWECCRSTLNKDDAGKKIVLLGDRWETLLLAFRATELECITFHLHGGEETLGSKDNIYRKAITSLSHVHLTAHQKFADRVVRMGELPDNVFVTGALGVWRAKRCPGGWPTDLKHLIVILHPNTIAPNKTEKECIALLNALESFKEFHIYFYAPNYDDGRDIINRKIKAFCELHDNADYIESEYGDQFLYRLKASKCIIGNSSCGIIEAPSLRVPTINIGKRQDGRPMAGSIMNCDFNEKEIKLHIDAITNLNLNTDAWKNRFKNPYDNVEYDTVDMICNIIRNHPVEFQKRFTE